MKTLLYCSLGVLLLVLLAGCDGSGVGGGVVLALRQVQAGDSFTYHIADSGMGDAWDETWTFNTHAPIGLINVSDTTDLFRFLIYDGDGSLDTWTGIGDIPEEEKLHFEAFMQAGQNVSTSGFYPGELFLEGPESVTVTAGTFQAFKFTHNEEGGGYTSWWIVPSLGMLVKAYGIDGPYIYSLELTSYSLAD